MSFTKYSLPSARQPNKMASRYVFVEIKSIFQVASFSLVGYILKQLFTSVSVDVEGIREFKDTTTATVEKIACVTDVFAVVASLQRKVTYVLFG